MKTESNLGAMAEAVAMSAGVEWSKRIFTQWDNGGIELYRIVAHLAQISSDLVEDLMIANIPFAGVWAYNVSENFGNAIPFLVDEHRSTFCIEKAKVKLGEIAYRNVCGSRNFLTDQEHSLAASIIYRWTDYKSPISDTLALHANETA
jgi:hypothetical protein